ncbi:MAG: L-rhamnose mutarotase [Planctomycetes bacterium]|nr:L-rhamnose mutarotase [Planctomycetota bacterium]
MKRVGSVIELLPDKVDEYRRLHAAAWPGVLAKISECGLRNYSIFLKRFDDGRCYLFSYFEYVGDDFEADCARIAADPTTREWWQLTDPCQRPLENRASGEWWATMEEVFHHD